MEERGEDVCMREATGGTVVVCVAAEVIFVGIE
jgi:hypothetical protein